MADFPLPMSEAFLGTLDNPAISQSYRKAVIRPAPSVFTVEIYPPRKQGANFHYGMRIIPSESPTSPVLSDVRSSKSTKSNKYKEYDMFRRWEDCLDFQRTLELEYESVSRRRRKGQPAFNHHAKNKLYPAQRAASFDSLPLGPDPSTIAMDVHEYIPKLSKKSTLFRANQATVTQRGQEFKAMIEALLDEDAHSTIQELRTVPVVRDFFALWRRDKEAERKGSKITATMSAPPVPETINVPALPPAANVVKPSPTIDHLNAFLHTPSITTTPKSPKPISKTSYAPSGSIGRPHTANPGETSFQRSLPFISHPFNAVHDEEPLSDGPPVSSRLGPPLRTRRSTTVPNIEYVPTGARLGAMSDAESRAREPLLLRTIKDNNGMRHAPASQVSTPELPSSHHLERRLSRDLASRNVDTRVVPVSGVTPMPVFMLSQRHTSQPSGARLATFRDTAEEPTDDQKPLRSFPFDHPDSPPVTPGLAVFGVGRVGGRQLDSLAFMDPEMYHSLSARQAPQSPPWNLPTPTNVESGQVVPRARKTPPILDQGNRSARFFVDDPAAGMVDVAGGPPPHSPITASAPIGMDTPHDEVDHFEQVAVSRKLQAMKLERPPVGRTTPPIKPPLEVLDHGHDYTYSGPSDPSVSGLLSPNASSRSSQGSSLSTTGVNNQRFRPRGSLGSVAERRLSLDSLIASDFELPYPSRNISTPQFSQKNKSADHVYAALDALNAPLATVNSYGRSSYSSQETDSTGFGLEDNLGMTSSGSSQYAPARLPISKATVISPVATPPPRPPRSALRNSSQFSAGITHRPHEPLNLNHLPELSPAGAHDFIDSYFATPQLKHAALEPPQAPYMGHGHMSSMSTLQSTLQYYQNTPDHYELDSSVGSVPSSPFTATFDPASSGPHMLNYRNLPPNTGAIPIKAVHAQSETIVLFKISRHGTTLADLRGKVVRKFQEAEGLELNGFSLKYLPQRSDHGFISTPTGRKRATSVSSTNDISALSSLDNETDWQRALAGNSKIIIRIV